MTLIEIIGTISVPITILSTTAMLFVSVALATKKNRIETLKIIQTYNFGVDKFSTLARLWALYFQRLFGENIFAKRQLLSIPLYTLTVSGVFFLTWVVYLYLFKNPTYSFNVSLPPIMDQSISDFFHKGIIAALVIDFITIQLSKVCIRRGNKYGFYSSQFFLMFSITIISAYLIFSLAILIFRIEDMVRLYTALAPNDQMPIIPYEPLTYISSSLNLFSPQTIMHVTTQGVFSTYFMPEPLIFYCAVAGQLSLVFIAFGYLIAAGLEKIKNISVGFIRHVGTPQANAYSVIFLVLLGLVSMPVIILALYAMLSRW